MRIHSLINELKGLSGSQISMDTLFNFDNQEPGTIPAGWTNVSGSWNVKQDVNGKVLAQMAGNRGMDFNVAVFDEAILKDVELSLDIRAMTGDEDQGEE